LFGLFVVLSVVPGVDTVFDLSRDLFQLGKISPRMSISSQEEDEINNNGESQNEYSDDSLFDGISEYSDPMHFL
jgi:hypothetical protein